MSNQKLENLTPDATIAQIIEANSGAAELLASIGLSPGDYKENTLRSVCQDQKWSEVEVLQWLKKNQRKSTYTQTESAGLGDDLEKWCSYLQENYLAKNAELLNDTAAHFSRVHKIHGNQYEWLKNIRWYVKTLDEKLGFYFYFQREKLYPLLDELSNSPKNILHGTIKKITHGIEILEEDRHEILHLIRSIKERSEQDPAGTCSTLRIFYQDLETLLSSLKEQIEIERKHLIPLTKRKLKQE